MESNRYWENYPYNNKDKDMINRDDFFLHDVNVKDHIYHGEEEDQHEKIKTEEDLLQPVIPSKNYYCDNQYQWVLIRSQMNYKFLWMHTSDMFMSATGTHDTPIHHISFHFSSIDPNCHSNSNSNYNSSITTSSFSSSVDKSNDNTTSNDDNINGWMLLQEGDSEKYIHMILSTEKVDPYVIKLGTDDINIAKEDISYHFLLEKEGYILNKGTMGFLNVDAVTDYPVRGYSYWDHTKPAKRDYGALMKFEFINTTEVLDAIQKEAKEEKDAFDEDKKELQLISTFPINNQEKRVISYGLYGDKLKYTNGAIKNVQLSKIYYPGWICRFYVTEDVPLDVITKLKQLGAEVMQIPAGKGYVSGMFWRFMVASDPAVDRYIIRDSDSRLNARERIAVEEWIDSKYPIHIMRDHVNHCLVMNGGMWGGVKGAINDMSGKIEAWSSRDQYSADLNFLGEKIWPEVKNNQLSHDSYCCDRFPNARPFPTKRPMTYQHVGQVFDEEDHPRLNDIDGYIRGVPTPGSCRKHADWIFG